MAFANAFQRPLPSSTSAPSKPASSFPINHALLNPRFEAYRLIQDNPDGTASYQQDAQPLPSRPLGLQQAFDLGLSSTDAQHTTTLGVKEAAERAQHRFLAPARFQGPSAAGNPVAGYIDKSGFVVLLTVDLSSDPKGKSKSVAHPVHRLDLDSTPPQRYSRSLPSLLSVSPTRWIAANGCGMLYVLDVELFHQPGGGQRWITKSVSTWIVEDGAGIAIPFSAINAELDALDRIHVLAQTCRKDARSGMAPQRTNRGLGYAGNPTTSSSATSTHVGPPGSSETLFDVRLLLLDLAGVKAADAPATQNQAQVTWSVVGQQPLLYSKLDLATGHHLLGAETGYSPAEGSAAEAASGDQRASPRHQPSALSADAAGSPTSTVPSGVSFRPRRPPHYSWAQTSDTLTIAFCLPSSIPKAALRVHLSIQGISLSLAPSSTTDSMKREKAEEGGEPDPLDHAANLVRSGRYVSRPLWAEIDPSGSVWTWEQAVGQSGAYKGRPMGVLTLHLEKKHEGTRWLQVFADRRQSGGQSKRDGGGLSKWEEVSKKAKLSFREARERVERAAGGQLEEGGDALMDGLHEVESEEMEAGKAPSMAEAAEDEESVEEDEEDDVPETMDPSELLDMLEGMEKYTIDEWAIGPERGDQAPLGLDRTGFNDQPSLLRDGLEEEDDNVGHPFVLSWISELHKPLTPSAPQNAGICVDRPARDATENRPILALPLSTHGEDEDSQTSIAIKYDLDGAIFAPPASPARLVSASDQADVQSWLHIDTLPALAFVLASKRDAHRIYVHRSKPAARPTLGYSSAILAFESAPQLGLDTTAPSSTQSRTAPDAGNLFVYYSPAPAIGSEKEKYAKARVIRLGVGAGSERGEGSGALLGVAAIPEREGQGSVLLCLCEQTLLLLRNVL